MATSPPSGHQQLSQAILAQARRQSEEILQAAQQQAALLLAQAATEGQKAHEAILNDARAEASQKAESILATIPIETGRLRAARIESLLESVGDEVRRRLRAHEGFDFRKTIATLAAAAARRMTGSRLLVKVAAGQGLRLEDLAIDIARQAGCSTETLIISEDPDLKDGGPIIASAAGNELWDNGLPARLSRLWPELRRQIAVCAGLVSEAPTPHDNS
jgi:vacuolar-type H+-ATPase subunit E/Vma4